MNLWVLLLFLSLPVMSTEKSDHFDGEHFFNPGMDVGKGLFDVLKWKLTTKGKEWPESVQNKNWPAPVLMEGKKANITFINHATFLIQTPQLTILTDPVFSERVSPFSFIGPKRVRPPGVALDDLPPVDVVLVSHAHYDHMDIESLRALDAKFHPLFIVGLHNRKFLMEKGIQNVVELDWWQEQKIKNATITFTQCLHWANRSPWDKNETLWGAFMISYEGKKIYFGGDTGYGDHFRDTKVRLGAPDIALLPIGAYEPRWFMKEMHMNPEESVKAHKDLEAGHSFGMHFGTFQLTDEGIDDPVIDLKKALGEITNFTVLEQGQSQAF
jgi:L-ascorbate metabolism protein UlaG (beta-lactamase superfamily)